MKTAERDDLLIRIDERQISMYKEIKEINSKNKDQDGEIDKLNVWKNRTIGAIGLLTFIMIGTISIVAAIIGR